MRNLIDKILNWYFSKNSLPYWCIFMIDCGIVMASGIMTYWLFNSTQALYDNTFRVINTLICFALLSVPGFRFFHTYAGHTADVVLPRFREDSLRCSVFWWQMHAYTYNAIVKHFKNNIWKKVWIIFEDCNFCSTFAAKK